MTMMKASAFALLCSLALGLAGCPEKKSEAESPQTTATAEPAAEAKPADPAQPAAEPAPAEAKPVEPKAEPKDQGGGW